jgi:hypothetical protein
MKEKWQTLSGKSKMWIIIGVAALIAASAIWG